MQHGRVLSCLVLGLEEELALAQPHLFAPVGVELLFHLTTTLQNAHSKMYTVHSTNCIYTIHNMQRQFIHRAHNYVTTVHKVQYTLHLVFYNSTV